MSSKKISQFAPVQGYDRCYVRRVSPEELSQRARDGHKPQPYRFDVKSRDPRVTFHQRYSLFDRDGQTVNYIKKIRDDRLRREMERLGVACDPEQDATRQSALLSVMLSQITTASNGNTTADDDDDEDVESVMDIEHGRAESVVDDYRPTPFVHPTVDDTLSSMTAGSTATTVSIGGGTNEFRYSEVPSMASSRSTLQSTASRPSRFSVRKSSRLTTQLGADQPPRSEIINPDVSGESTTSDVIQTRDTAVNPPVESVVISLNTTATTTSNNSRDSEVISMRDTERLSTQHAPRSFNQNGGLARFDASRFTFAGDLNPRDSSVRPTKELFGRSTCLTSAKTDIKYTPIKTAATTSMINLEDDALCAKLDANFSEAAIQVGTFTEHRCVGPLPALHEGASVVLADETFTVAAAFPNDVFTAHSGHSACLMYSSTRQEAERAAVGLFSCCPEVAVSAFDFDDGCFTVIRYPSEVVQLSTLCHDKQILPATSFVTVAKVLRPLTANLQVHGSLSAENIFVTVCAGGCVAIPVHWDRFLDFRMFSDCRAGRAIPTGTRRETITIGYDTEHLLNQQLEVSSKLAAFTRTESLALTKVVDAACSPKPMQANITINLDSALTALDANANRMAFVQAFQAEFDRVYCGVGN